MMEDRKTFIREQLARIKTLTDSAKGIESPSFWVGDRAGERRADDDLRSGRLAFRDAHNFAVMGLAALDRGEVASAETAMRAAKDLYADARPKKKSRAALAVSAKRRGRKKETEERNRRLSEAVAAQEALGLTGSAAVAAAKRADPTLSAEIKGLGRAAIRKALREARKT